MNYIERAYVVSLQPDRENRWLEFNDINDDRLQLWHAVDTRGKWKALTKLDKYNFTLDPLPGSCSDYFSQSFGAIGCYLSHYLIWKDIVNKGLKCTLVLEDDAIIEDVIKVLNCDTDQHPGYLTAALLDPFHLVQLNKRTPINNKISMFAGTESYLLSLEGAKRLIYLAETASCFMGKVNKPVVYKNDTDIPDTIAPFTVDDGKRMWIAVDKFMGLCGMSSIPDELRVSLAVVPRVGLRETQVVSDCIDLSEYKAHWKMKPSMLKRFRNRADYYWWAPKRKVFEIGVKKTGTSSFGAALRQLGYKVAKWDPELYHNWVTTGDCTDILNQCEDFDGFEDGPWHDIDHSLIYDQYPDALYVILDRDNDSWLKSLEKHESPEINANSIDTEWLEERWITDRDNYVEEMLDFKLKKYSYVREYFKNKPGQLLDLNIFTDPDAMQTLCDFLGVTRPTGMMFPHRNKSDQ